MSARPNLTMSRRAWAAGLLACCAVLLTSGCGPDYKARATVKGKVTRGGKPLTTGTVMFVNKEGMSGSASITPEGTYELSDAPLGECTVTVTVNMSNDPSVRARMKGKGVAMPEGPKDPNATESPEPPSGARVPTEVVPIDQKFSDPETSGLKFTVQKGEQTYNIEL